MTPITPESLRAAGFTSKGSVVFWRVIHANLEVWVHPHKGTWEVNVEDNDGQSIDVGTRESIEQLTALCAMLKGEG